MKNLSAALLLQKNKIATPNPWLITLDVTWPDASNSYFVRNTENITFQSRTYVAFPFEIDTTGETSKGDIPAVTLKVSNVGRALVPFFEATDGAVGSTVIVRVINAALLTENYADLELTYEVMSAAMDNDWVTMTLGAPNPLRHKFPRYRYVALHCNWIFKGAECGAGTTGTSCDKTLDSCRGGAGTARAGLVSNATRFGGFPGISGGLRIA